MQRVLVAAMGLALVAIAAYSAFAVADDWLTFLLAALVGGLGIDGIYSAVRGKRALISRIGPLP